MYRCNDCGEYFDEPEEKHTSYESYYGVAGDFPTRTPLTLYICPWCFGEDFEEATEDDLEEIYEEEEYDYRDEPDYETRSERLMVDAAVERWKEERGK